MVQKLFRPVLIGLLFMISVDVCFSQSSNWDNVTALSGGTRLVVEQDGGKAAKGKFASATADSLFLSTGGRQVEIARTSISAVYLGTKGSRTKRAIVGALAGAGAGVLIGAVAVAATKGDPLIAAGGFLFGLPAGAAIGAATGGGTKRGELIYKR